MMSEKYEYVETNFDEDDRVFDESLYQTVPDVQ